MSRFGNDQRLGSWVDGLEHSKSMPRVDEAIGEEHLGQRQVEATVAIVGELDRSFNKCPVELTAKYVDALLHEKVTGKVFAKGLRGIVARLKEAKFGACLVGPQSTWSR